MNDTNGPQLAFNYHQINLILPHSTFFRSLLNKVKYEYFEKPIYPFNDDPYGNFRVILVLKMHQKKH